MVTLVRMYCLSPAISSCSCGCEMKGSRSEFRSCYLVYRRHDLYRVCTFKQLKKKKLFVLG